MSKISSSKPFLCIRSDCKINSIIAKLKGYCCFKNIYIFTISFTACCNGQKIKYHLRFYFKRLNEHLVLCEEEKRNVWLFLPPSNQEAIATLLNTLLTQRSGPQEKSHVLTAEDISKTSYNRRRRWSVRNRAFRSAQEVWGEQRCSYAPANSAATACQSHSATSIITATAKGRSPAEVISQRVKCKTLDRKQYHRQMNSSSWLMNSLVFHSIWFGKYSNHIHISYSQHDILLDRVWIRKNCCL